MLFKRRKPAEFWERVRLALWPRRSFLRSARYFTKRVLRLRATPHAVAAGVAAGVFAAFFPVGIHLVVALAIAWLLAGNLVAAAIGTAVGNPLTLPFMWSGTYELGHMILHRGEPGAIQSANIGSLIEEIGVAALWKPLLEPMIVGAVPLGLVFAVAAYGATRWSVSAFHARRQARLAMKASGNATAAAP
ncbi:MAG: DUF2062 domain-containing protein [Hyphomicrobiales bacterium]|nr:DUF2062 domain-containing protein [Hyphomicrobiales bacterium]